MREINKLEVIKPNYDDIINLPHHVSNKYKKMSIENRASQFAPFQALTGYSDEIRETARITYDRVDIDEDTQIKINDTLKIINTNIKNTPNVCITYFMNDCKKAGGNYIKTNKSIKRVDSVYKKLIFTDKTSISINDIIDIHLNN